MSPSIIFVNMTNAGTNTIFVKFYDNGDEVPPGVVSLAPATGGSCGSVTYKKVNPGTSSHGFGYVMYPRGKEVEASFTVTFS